MLLFAYGANLNLRGMKRRCPKAVAVTATKLSGYRFEFRGFATIVPDSAGQVLGALYRLSPACWRALDDYEGPRYSKIAVSVEGQGGVCAAITYVMTAGERAAPTVAYYTAIARGYGDWKLDAAPLRRARLATLHPEKVKTLPLGRTKL